MLGSRVLFLLLSAAPLYARAQGYPEQVPAHKANNSSAIEAAPPPTAHLRSEAARNDLLSAFQAENKRGTYIFYTQTYSLHGRRIEFHGSIFGVVDGVEADGCELKIQSTLLDLYSGNIGRKLVNQTQSKYITSVNFRITPAMAEGLKIVNGRPVRQLAEDTNAVCSGDRPCTLTWLKLRSDTPVIHETDVTDDVADYDGEVKDFDGSVDQVYWPVSSASAGNEIITKMRAFAESCAK